MSRQPAPDAHQAAPLVLVGFADALASIESTWSLLDAGFRVATFARRSTKPPVRHIKGLQSFSICAPEASAKQSVTDLAALIRRLRPDAVLPLDDQALWLSTETRYDTPLAGPPREAIRVALDKSAQLQLAEASGLLAPPTQTVCAFDDDLRLMKWPIVAKPGRALYEKNDVLARPIGAICSDPSELSMALKRFSQPVLVQPYIDGVGEGLFGYASSHGVMAWSAHRRIRMVNPHGSGSSACESREIDGRLLEPAERFLRSLDWRGHFMLEFLRDRHDRAWFMELNGRAWGSMALARSRGFEYPAWTVQGFLDAEFQPSVPSVPKPRRARHVALEIAHLAFVLRGPQWRGGVQDWPNGWQTLIDLLTIRRGDVLYNWRPSEPLVFVSDTLSTLRSFGRRAFWGAR